MNYQLKKEYFNGPLDLLLDLIEKKKMNITRISLAEIADDYLEYLEKKENIELAHLADFLAVASKLILIKSKELLPFLVLDEEEEDEIKNLEQKLDEYKKFKEISVLLGKMISARRQSFSRESFSNTPVVFSFPEDLTAGKLLAVFKKKLEEISLPEKLEEETWQEVISLEKKIEYLQEKLLTKVETSFFELTREANDKVEVVVSFLAILEMVKRRIIQVKQEDLFKDIKIIID